ncbi:MAG: VOC family protein [Myxococcota bacterium]
MSDLAIEEMKPFIPATDYAKSLEFYVALGFEVASDMGELAYLKFEATSFLLQDYSQPDFAKHYMMHLQVEDVDAWHAHVVSAGVVERFGVKLGEPQEQPWRMRDFTLTDPSGVLWRIAQRI